MSVAATNNGGAILSRWATRDVYGALFANVGEAIVALQSSAASIPAIWILAGHLAVVASVATILFNARPKGEDLTIAATMVLIILVAGPVGAVASLVMLPFVKTTNPGSPVLRAWYKRLSSAGSVGPATAMHDRVAAGRVLRLEAAPPASFLDVIKAGTLDERQTALGLMARKFHPDYAPALEAALRSPEPVVRVQAAAVVARVRGDLKERIKSLVSAEGHVGSPRPAARLADAGELYRLARCTLVEGTDRAASEAGARALLSGMLTTSHTIVNASAQPDPDTALAIEGYLLAEGRYKHFRVARRVNSIVTRGGYGIRLLKKSGAQW